MQATEASWVASATASGGSRQGAETLWQGNALAKTDDFTEDRDCKIIDLPVRRICRLRFPDGWRSFALWVSLSRPRVKGTRARDIPRTTIGCTRKTRRATGRAIRLCGRRYSALTTSPALW